MVVLKYHACIMHASRWSEDTWMHCCIFFAYQFCERSLLSVCWRLKAGRCRDCVSDASVPSHSCGNTHIHSIHCLHSHYSNRRRWRHTRLFLFSGSVNIRRQLWLLRLKFHRTELLRCYSYPASGHFVRCRQYFDPRSAPWASPHLLSLVTAVNLELSATLAGCFHFSSYWCSLGGWS